MKGKCFKRITMMFMLFMVSVTTLLAQSVKVNGTVQDNTGEPVIGASILEKGTTNGTITDMDGKFTLTTKRGATLVISYVGYVSQEIQASANVNVTLKEDTEVLDELVVVGYGVQKKSNVTGAIASVKAGDLENRSNDNVGSAMQGKLAGLQVFTTSSAPGASTTFRIRGYSSTSGSSDPLYLVDGLKVKSIDYLDPGSIESIEVLKDAASAAIYGAEAGNGVVLITTKNGGDKGTSKIFYNGQLTVSSQARKLAMMNATEFKDYWKRAGRVNNDDVFGNADTDWQDEMLETGFMQKHTIGAQGSNDKGNYYVSLTYLKQDGVIKSDKDTNERFTAQVNGSYKIRPWLTVGTTNSIERGKTVGVSEQSAHSSASQSIFYYDPTVPVAYANDSDAPASLIAAEAAGSHVFRNAAGQLYGVSQVMTSSMYNPLIMLEYQDDATWRTNVNGTIYADFTPIKGLVFTSKLGYRIGTTYYNNYTSPYYLTPKQQSSAPSLSSGNTNNFYYQWENYLNYNKSFGKHDIGVMAGMQYADTRYELVSGTTNELSSLEENYRYLNYGTSTAANRMPSGTNYSRRNISYFGRLSYTYDSKYMVQVNFRADAFDSSKLSKQQRWGYFPSVSAGWVVSNEGFMKDINKSTLSYLKLRASWGVNGNVNSLDNYPYSSYMVAGPASNYWLYGLYWGVKDYYNFDGSGLTMGTAPATTLPNNSLTWEESKQFDFGFDARFFNDRLTLTYDYYSKTTTGMLGTISAPFISGCTSQIINAGKIANWGHDFELGWKDRIGKDFSYSISANFSTVKNEVKESPYGEGRYFTSTSDDAAANVCLEAGYPMWSLRLYHVDHIDPETGASVYSDGETEGANADGKEYVGNAFPDFTYGLTISAQYKNWDFSIFGSGVQGVDKFLNIYWTSEPMINMPKFIYNDTWSSTNTNAKYGVPSISDTKIGKSDTWVYDASYFRIKQIQLGYTLPKTFTKKFASDEVRIYCSLEDFFTFTSYPGEPESRAGFGQYMAIDNISYPSTKRVLFGLNISF